MTEITLFGADYSGVSITPSRACEAPAAVRLVLPRYKQWDAVRKVEVPTFNDIGDAGVAAATSWDDAFAGIVRLAGEATGFAVALGGDHSVTWPLVAAFAQRVEGRVGVIQLDVHHDVRALAEGPKNGTPIRGLIENGLVRGEDVVQLGIHRHANTPVLGEYCAEAGIVWSSLEDIRSLGPEAAAASALIELAECDAIYLTVDIDVLDRAYAPGTVAALSGGLTPDELLRMVDTICGDPRTSAMDVVEFDPTRDARQITAHAVAAVVMRAASAVAARESS